MKKQRLLKMKSLADSISVRSTTRQRNPNRKNSSFR